MSNTDLRKDLGGNDMLVLDSGNFYETEVAVEYGEISFYLDEGYENQFISICLEDWEEVKAFVDNQISIKGE